jgi:hypothetical protein
VAAPAAAALAIQKMTNTADNLNSHLFSHNKLQNYMMRLRDKTCPWLWTGFIVICSENK